ncbi:MAG: hypothetical protein Q9162_005588 [Coniocarpon cinnabarinum]
MVNFYILAASHWQLLYLTDIPEGIFATYEFGVKLPIIGFAGRQQRVLYNAGVSPENARAVIAKSFQLSARQRHISSSDSKRLASSSAPRRQQVAITEGIEQDGFVPFDAASLPGSAILGSATRHGPAPSSFTAHQHGPPDDAEPSIQIREDLRVGDVPSSQDGLGAACKAAKGEGEEEASLQTSRSRSDVEKTTSGEDHSRGIRKNPAMSIKASPRPALPRPSRHREPWQTQKAVLNEKFPTGWSPPKKLSPDAQDGIRALHAHDPTSFSTALLSKQFEVSPEAIRRILRSKWRPNAEEDEKRRERWERRGEKIWQGLVEKGVHAPKAWRTKGIGTGPRRPGQDRSMKNADRVETASKAVRTGHTEDSGKRWLGGLTGRVG